MLDAKDLADVSSRMTPRCFQAVLGALASRRRGSCEKATAGSLSQLVYTCIKRNVKQILEFACFEREQWYYATGFGPITS